MNYKIEWHTHGLEQKVLLMKGTSFMKIEKVIAKSAKPFAMFRPVFLFNVF